jgi:hypothetical protein
VDKINQVTNAITGGLAGAKQHIREITNDLKEMVRQANRFSSTMGTAGGTGGGGGGDLNVGGGGSVFNNNPSFGGAQGGQPIGSSFGPAAVRVGGAAFAGLQAALPGAGTAITTDAIISYQRFFGNLSGRQTQGLLNTMNRTGLATSRTDAAGSLLEAQRYGFTGQGNFASTITTSAADVSRLTPGAGLTGGMQVMGTLNQARGVNMMRMLGIQVRDPRTGEPKSFQEVGNQIFQMITNNLGRAPTKKDINSSLLPGSGLYNFLNDVYGTDELTKNTIIRYLLQKAQGGNLSADSLLQTGATTSTQQLLGGFQGTKGAITAATSPILSGAVGLGAGALNLLLSPLAALLKLLTTGIPGLQDGGEAKKGKPYIVGEKEAEIFVPKEDGVVVPSGGKGGPFDRAGWAKKVLGGMGAPTSETNVQAMMRWMAQEGGHSNNSAYFNPLNTTKSMPGELGVMNSHGVRRYANWDMGFDATLKTLNLNYYKAVVDAFRSNADPKEIYHAIVTSKWGTKNLPASGAQGLYDSSKYGGGGGGSGIASSGGSESSGVGSGGGGEGGYAAASGAGAYRAGSAGMGTVNYGGVNISINGANISARDLVEEIKRQLKYESIVNMIGAS